MLNDWKVDPNGYPRLLQMVVASYGWSPDVIIRSETIVSMSDNEDESSDHINFTKCNSQDETPRSNCSGATHTKGADEEKDSRSKPLESLRTVTLQQPQQKIFERMEKKFSSLFTHPCLSVTAIKKMVSQARGFDVRKDLSTSAGKLSFSDQCTVNSTTAIYKSLLTIVNTTAYGSSGGGIMYNFLLKNYIRPLNKLRILVSMLTFSREKVIDPESSSLNDFVLKGINFLQF